MVLKGQIRNLCAGAVVVAGVAGCAGQKPVEQAAVATSDPALMQLVSAASRVNARTAVTDQILTERYKIEEEDQLPVEGLPAGLQRVVSFPGGEQLELDVVIKELCRLSGVRYLHPQGVKPLTPIYAMYDDQLRTVGEFIADAGRQATYRADVVLNLNVSPVTVQILYKDVRL